MCRRHVMEAGLLMLLSFHVGDDACRSSSHAPLFPTPPPSLVLTPPLRRLLCASTGHRFLSRCGRLSSSCSRRSSWGDGERKSKAIASRYTMGFSPAYTPTPPSRQRYCWSSRTCSGRTFTARSVHTGCERGECRGRGDAPAAARG